VDNLEKIIDSHIHLDQYHDVEINEMLEKELSIEALISVSMNLESCKRNLLLAKQYSKVKPAFGFHPEQKLPSERELGDLLSWMEENIDHMIAVGEVGLPYFMRMEKQVTESEYGRYIELLEVFIKLAKKWDMPIGLHAVYTDSPVVCGILEKHSYAKAHFHWYKSDIKTTQRIIANGYFASVTPEVVMDEAESVIVVQSFPIEQLLVETDGPWPFEGPFSGRRTHPLMIVESLKKIAEIKKFELRDTAKQIRNNTKLLYKI
jgi:TatD DNase family protein